MEINLGEGDKSKGTRSRDGTNFALRKEKLLSGENREKHRTKAETEKKY